MRPSHEFNAKVRTRIIELTGTDPGPFKICDIFPGTDPNVTEEQKIEAIAKSMVHLHSAEEVDIDAIDDED